MPRDGSGQYHMPPGTLGVPDTTIESARYNAFVSDVELDLNTPRPIVAGGTGTTNPVDALVNMGGEVAGQNVTNYDAQVWQSGSFFSATGATSAPVAGHAFVGIVYMQDANNLFLQARDLNDAIQPGRLWVRGKVGGTWSTWSQREVVPISDNAPPTNPVVGQLWFDSSLGHLFIWYDDGNSQQWVVASPGSTSGGTGGGGGGSASIVISDTAPSSPTAGMMWFNSTNGMLYIFYTDPDSSQWVAITQAAPPINAIIFDGPQTLTSDQQNQAKANIGAIAKNYIINGGMQVSQENGGTAGSTNNYFPADQFYVALALSAGTVSTQQLANPTPAGSPNRIRLTVGTALATMAAGDLLAFAQAIEGLRVADLKLGTPAAKTMTLRFGCRASVAGTYAVAIANAAGNRSYVAEYTIAAGEINTDVVKSVTIPGDVVGTWAVDNTRGMTVVWCFGSGTTYRGVANSWQAGNVFSTPATLNMMATAGATFDLFDVGLYQGNVAQAFVLPDYVRELQECMRYFETGFEPELWLGGGLTATGGYGSLQFVVQKRSAPTVTPSNWQYWSGASTVAFTPTLNGTTTDFYWTQLSLTNWNGWNHTGTWKANARL